MAAGAGASLAFACDFRIAGETAGFLMAFARVGSGPTAVRRGRCSGWSASAARPRCSCWPSRSRRRRRWRWAWSTRSSPGPTSPGPPPSWPRSSPPAPRRRTPRSRRRGLRGGPRPVREPGQGGRDAGPVRRDRRPRRAVDGVPRQAAGDVHWALIGAARLRRGSPRGGRRRGRSPASARRRWSARRTGHRAGLRSLASATDSSLLPGPRRASAGRGAGGGREGDSTWCSRPPGRSATTRALPIVALDLRPVADDSRVGQQPRQTALHPSCTAKMATSSATHGW